MPISKFNHPSGLRARATLGALAALLFAQGALSPARAQKYEVGVVAGRASISDNFLGSVSVNDARDDDSRLTGEKYSYGARLTMNTPGYYGHEVSYINTKATFETKLPDGNGVRRTYSDKVRIEQVTYNFLMYFMPAGERWRPFIAVGGQMHRYGAPNVPGWLGGGSRKFGANYGGGIKLFPHKNLLFRLDARQYITGAPYDLSFAQGSVTQGFRSAGLFRQLELSAGFAIAF